MKFALSLLATKLEVKLSSTPNKKSTKYQNYLYSHKWPPHISTPPFHGQPHGGAPPPAVPAPSSFQHPSTYPKPVAHHHSRSRRLWVVRQRNIAQEQSPPKPTTFDAQELVDFLYEDLPHLFDDQGIDPTAYDDRVKFRDPITKHDSIGGYLFNIGMLRTLFRPDFLLHWVKQTGPYEITTRWTMVMRFLLLPWKPELVFTGTSVMGINPKLRSSAAMCLPAPNQAELNLRKVEGGIAAVSKFSGKPVEDIVREKEKALRSNLIRDGLKPKAGCVLARYNDPGRTWSFTMWSRVRFLWDFWIGFFGLKEAEGWNPVLGCASTLGCSAGWAVLDLVVYGAGHGAAADWAPIAGLLRTLD
ncbi:hypothetical protein Sango_2969900 [Sesamum angolense]|uniref:Uncharacterized protein n=1 Tax=Sesamum angolense TaxID=2727404 RepID=A0AAE1T4G3_9LAMI|nr:hypothetical protein Sango_2969900 [Sesamum angolense]